MRDDSVAQWTELYDTMSVFYADDESAIAMINYLREGLETRLPEITQDECLPTPTAP